MRNTSDRSRQWLVAGLVVIGIVARLLPHPPNATPLTALALFSGAYLSAPWSLLLPLFTVAFSDVVLGWHSTVPFTWGAFLLTGILGWWVRPQPTAARILTGTLAGSVLFFLISNFGVWATQDLYPRTLEGLGMCYVAAVPFFRAMVLGDVIYAGIFFGGYALASKTLPARSNPSLR